MKITETSLFKNVNIDAKILNDINLKKVNSKKIIVEEGTLSSPCLFIVKSGLVVISKTDVNGSEVSLASKNSGDYFGQFSIFYDKPVNGKAVSLVDTEYWTLTGSFLELVLLKDANFTFNLFKDATNYLKASYENRIIDLHGGAQKKIVYQLMKLGKKDTINNQIIIDANLNQYIISSLAGITRETVSREIQKLKKSNILLVNEKKQWMLDINLANLLLEAS